MKQQSKEDVIHLVTKSNLWTPIIHSIADWFNKWDIFLSTNWLPAFMGLTEWYNGLGRRISFISSQHYLLRGPRLCGHWLKLRHRQNKLNCHGLTSRKAYSAHLNTLQWSLKDGHLRTLRVWVGNWVISSCIMMLKLQTIQMVK